MKNPIASVYCSGNNPAPNRSFKQAMRLIGMPKRLFIKESVIRGFGRGFVVNLEELAVLLEYVSYDVHRWEMIGDDTGEWGDTQRIFVRYSNPGDPHLPDPISVRFPCLVEVDPRGKAVRVYDIGTVPKQISATPKNLYILTATRLYVLQGDKLQAVVDVFDQGKLVVAHMGFGLLQPKSLRRFTPDGLELGEVQTKDPYEEYFSEVRVWWSKRVLTVLYLMELHLGGSSDSKKEVANAHLLLS